MGKVKEIRLQQILTQDGSVYSMQSMDVPAGFRERVQPALLLQRYFDFIYRVTCSMIRVVVTRDTVDFSVFGSRLALLRFAPPEREEWEGGAAVHLCICGGLLVQPRERRRGKLSFISESAAEQVRVTLLLSDFCPLLLGSATPSWFRRHLYRWTQAYIHKVVTVRFLAKVCREISGEKARIRVKKVRVREGEEI